MSEFITTNFRGATITVCLTGLPILITGQVLIPQNTSCQNGQNNVLLLKTEDDRLIYIAAKFIAFFF